jgi:hypothetical protein
MNEGLSGCAYPGGLGLKRTLAHSPRAIYEDQWRECRPVFNHGTTNLQGARGGVVIKGLRYEPAGRGFDSRWCYWNFSVT